MASKTPGSLTSHPIHTLKASATSATRTANVKTANPSVTFDSRQFISICSGFSSFFFPFFSLINSWLWLVLNTVGDRPSEDKVLFNLSLFILVFYICPASADSERWNGIECKTIIWTYNIIWLCLGRKLVHRSSRPSDNICCFRSYLRALIGMGSDGG